MTQTSSPDQSYNKGIHPDQVGVSLVVNDLAEAFVFHDKPFKKSVSWLEYDLDSHMLQFIMEDGDIRDFGIPVDPKLEKHLQNAFQVLMVQLDTKTGEEQEKSYFPLIIHRA